MHGSDGCQGATLAVALPLWAAFGSLGIEGEGAIGCALSMPARDRLYQDPISVDARRRQAPVVEDMKLFSPMMRPSFAGYWKKRTVVSW